MIHLADLTWFPRPHRDIVTLAQGCLSCIKIGKNLKPKIPKKTISKIPRFQESNDEIQKLLAGTVTNDNSKKHACLKIKIGNHAT